MCVQLHSFVPAGQLSYILEHLLTVELSSQSYLQHGIPA